MPGGIEEERCAGDADDVEIPEVAFEATGGVRAEDVHVIMAENEDVAFASGDAAVVAFGKRPGIIDANEFPVGAVKDAFIHRLDGVEASGIDAADDDGEHSVPAFRRLIQPILGGHYLEGFGPVVDENESAMKGPPLNGR